MKLLVLSYSKEQYLGSNNHKELVMQVLVSLRFGNGDFQHGFEKIALSASVIDSQDSTELEIKLPPAPLIPNLYQNWQDRYNELVETRVRKFLPSRTVPANIYTKNARGFRKQQPTNFSYQQCQKECNQYAEDLRNQINQWLAVIESQLEVAFDLDAKSDILLTISTEHITSGLTKDILHRLPWQEWDYFNDSSAFEAILCLSESGFDSPEVVDNKIFRRVRITSIFGDSQDIDVAADKELIVKLQKRGAELINLEQPQRQDFIKLWDEPCDILFYSGHSESGFNGTLGSLQINSEESLNLQEIRNTFQEAIRKGLQLAIFNSCDGLGLAKQLADLHLPYIIVWREPVPDKIAQRFLEYFLSSYAEGKCLFNSVRDARIKLVELTNSDEKEKQIPGLNWLPIICKNTLAAPPTWEDLGGLTGKLPESPYQGLSAFEEEDKDFFFGRDDVIADLVEAVNSRPLVPVIGASGSGKSSVVFAGLVPQLKESGNVQIVSFRPGKNPFDALAIALTKIQNVELNNRLQELQLEVNLKHDKKSLCRFIEEKIKYQNNNSSHFKCSGAKRSNRRFVIIADQFEELYTLTPESQRQYALDTLLYAVQYAPLFSLVLTLRADFLGKVLDYQPMGEAFKKYPPVLLTPMKREELQAAIEQPAAKMKVELEQGLTSKLIDDLGNQPGRLPLLEFTLSLLWSKHDKWYLTHKAYEEIGGLEKALAKYADGVLNSLSVADKEKAERIFIQLISPGEGTEDTKRKATCEEIGEDNWVLVEELANNRLVVTGWDESSQQETVEIIHEALIREWGMLRGWIQSNRRFRIWQERLQFEVVKWHKKRDENYLLSGGNLSEAEDWYFDKKYREYLSNSQKEFIQDSLNKRLGEEKKKEYQQQEKLRLQKRANRWLSGGLVAASLAIGFAGWNWVKADINATREKLNNSVAISEKYFNLQNYGDALFEAIKAQQLLDNTWWKKWLPTHIEPKVKIAIHQPTHLLTEAKRTITGHKDSVMSVKFSPVSAASPKGIANTIASASEDGTVKLWSAQDGKLLHTITGHKDSVMSVGFSPVSAAFPKGIGDTIASASRDGTVKLWSAQDGKLLHTITGHKGSVHSVDFSPDGNTIASASNDKTVKLWSAQHGKLIHTTTGHKSEVTSVEFSPDGNTIASASNDKTVKLWSAQHGKLIHTITGHKDWVVDVEFSPDSNTIISASHDQTVKLWSAQHGKLIHTITGHKSEVGAVEFSPDGDTIVSGALDGTVKLWSASKSRDTIFTPNGKLVHTITGHKSEVSDVEFSPDGNTIASASTDKTVKLWSAQDGKLLYTFWGHKDEVISVKFSPDGNTIASASTDKTVKLWSAQDGKLLYTFWGHKDEVMSVEFSPDGNTIASASEDGMVKLWSAQDGKLLHTITGHKSEVTSVKFSPDGNTIASASKDETVKLWSTQDGKLLHTITGHKNWGVSSVKFSPDGNTIASGSLDETVKLWSAQDGKLLHTITGHKERVTSVEFSPDGKTIASASLDGTVKLWNWNFDNLLTRGCNKLQGYLVNSPEKLEELKVCQNQKILTAAASTLVRQGEELAINGDFEGAVAKFRKAKKWNPKLDINPEEKAKIVE